MPAGPAGLILPDGYRSVILYDTGERVQGEGNGPAGAPESWFP